MHNENLKERWQKINVIKDLCGAVQTPIEQVSHRSQSVSLQHVISIFADLAELVNHFDN